MKKVIIASVLVLVVVLSSVVTISVCNKKNSGFDEKNIVLTFSAMSDIHQQMGKTDYADKLTNALDYAKSLNGGNHLDVALFAGDLTEETWRIQNENYNLSYNGDVQMLKSTLDGALDIQQTAVFYCLGNHDTDPSELGAEYASKLPELFYNTLGQEYFAFDCEDSMPEIGLRHLERKGYHFFAVQPNNYWSLHGYAESTLEWLDAQLSVITAKEPEKYVFVTAHPPIYGTVFGSYASDWADVDLASVLEKYPQVIYFSGHIHNVLQDEMQISQNGKFTAVDCGSVKYTAVMNDMNDSRTTTFDNQIGTRIEDFSQGLLVQVDKGGNVRITRCDYYNRTTIKSAWELSKPNKDKSHLSKYDNETRLKNNQAPVFGSNATLTLSKTEEGILFNWDCATDDDMVRYYYLVVYSLDGGQKAKVKELNLATFTYQYSKASDMPKSMSYLAKGIAGENLIAEIYAVDVWNKRSEVLKSS